MSDQRVRDLTVLPSVCQGRLREDRKRNKDEVRKRLNKYTKVRKLRGVLKIFLFVRLT